MTATGSPAIVPELDVFRDPSSVAVVGASEDPAKWGYWLASGALAGIRRRRVQLVNRRADSVLGVQCAPSLSQLTEVPELIVLAVPARHVGVVVDEALELGVRGFLGITAGLPDEQRIAERIRAHGARLVGANSLGIFDAETTLQLAWGHFTAGSMAVVSQSGQLGSELATLGAHRGIGISRFVSIGNQSDVQAAELIAELADHDATQVVALYLESFTDGRTLFEALRTLRSAGKPTLLLTVGAGAASARLAESHTGSLTSTMDVVDAACRGASVARVNTPSTLIDAARTYLTTPVPSGKRVAVVGDSGGQCGVAADVAGSAGLSVPALYDPLASSLDATLPEGASHSNPVDLAGIGEEDLTNYASIAERLLESQQVDAVVLTGYFGCYGADAPSQQDHETTVARQLGKAVRNTGKPLVVHTMSPESETSALLWENSVPTFGRIEDAMQSLAASAELGGELADHVEPSHSDLSTTVDSGYWGARELLSNAGVRFPRAHLVHDAHEAADAGTRLAAPFVLKAGWLGHKSEAGGVVIGIADSTALTEAFIEMHTRLGDGDYVVEELDTRPATVEMLVGARQDPDFGPVVMLGAGGTEAEVHRDTTLDLAPVSAPHARTMCGRLRCAALLDGWRGRPPADVDSLATVVSAVSQVVAQRPDVTEIELNPVRVAADGALAVDALALTTGD